MILFTPSGLLPCSEETLAALTKVIGDAMADRDAHRRLDDDGAPASGEVTKDPYMDLVQATIRNCASQQRLSLRRL